MPADSDAGSGSVIGQQQQYMKDMQAKLWREGDLYAARMKQSKADSGIIPKYFHTHAMHWKQCLIFAVGPTEPKGAVGAPHRARRKLSGGAASLAGEMSSMSLGNSHSYSVQV